MGKELFAAGLAVAGCGLSRVTYARMAANVLLVVAATAGAWSIYQVVFVFGGASGPDYRATGFWHLGAVVSYGNVLAMVFALALGLALWGPRRDRDVAIVTGGLMCIGMLLSYTRASWITSATLVVVVSVWRRAVTPLIVLLLLVGVILLLPLGDVVTARALSIFDTTFVSNLDHLVRYRVGATIVRDYPMLGTGPGVLKLVYPQYALPGATDNVHLHNTYLQLLAERGPLGLLTWLLTMVWGMVHAFRSAREPEPQQQGLAIGIGLCLAAMLIVGMFNYVWEDWRVRSLTLAVLGLAWSGAVSRPRDKRKPASGGGGR